MLLQQIHTKYDTDKGKVHSYIEVYDGLFAPFTNAHINFLEIGALTCGSLKMFHDYFEKASIYGMDNWSQNYDWRNQTLNVQNLREEIANDWPRINLISADSTNTLMMHDKLAGLKFDIIIDDGNHEPWAQLASFQNLLPFWN